MKKVCVECGKEFETRPHGGSRITCYGECSLIRYRRIKSLTYIRNSSREKKCKRCGASFSGRGNYCSIECRVKSYNEAQSHKNKKTCRICGKYFNTMTDVEVVCFDCRTNQKNYYRHAVGTFNGSGYELNQVPQDKIDLSWMEKSYNAPLETYSTVWAG